MSDETKPPAVVALSHATEEIRRILEPALVKASVLAFERSTADDRMTSVRESVRAALAYVTERMEPASHARQVEPSPDLVRIRHLSALETRLEGALEDIEAVKDMGEDILRGVGRFDDINNAYETIRCIQRAVRLALTKANATPYG